MGSFSWGAPQRRFRKAAESGFLCFYARLGGVAFSHRVRRAAIHIEFSADRRGRESARQPVFKSFPGRRAANIVGVCAVGCISVGVGAALFGPSIAALISAFINSGVAVRARHVALEAEKAVDAARSLAGANAAALAAAFASAASTIDQGG